MRVLVTGASGPAGRSLLDQLHERGVAALGCDLHPVHRADGIRILPVPAADAPGFVSALREIVAIEEVDLVIPTVSEELPVVARAGMPEALVADASAVALAADKWLTAVTLREAGVAVPATLLPHQATAGGVGLPVLTKPRVSRGGRGVRLHETWPTEIADDDIVCEFAPGAEYCVEVHLGDAVEGATGVVLAKTALRSGLHGNAVDVVQAVDADVREIATLAVRACRVLGLSGPADVDIRRRADGTPVVLEINARFGAHSTAAPSVLDAVLRDARRRLGLTRPPVDAAPVAVRAIRPLETFARPA